MLNMAAGVSSPPVSLFAANAGWTGAEIRGTLQVYFLGLSSMALIVLGPPTSVPRGVIALCFVAIVLGTGAGLLLSTRLDERIVRGLGLVLAALGGGLLLAG